MDLVSFKVTISFPHMDKKTYLLIFIPPFDRAQINILVVTDFVVEILRSSSLVKFSSRSKALLVRGFAS